MILVFICYFEHETYFCQQVFFLNIWAKLLVTHDIAEIGLYSSLESSEVGCSI